MLWTRFARRRLAPTVLAAEICISGRLLSCMLVQRLVWNVGPGAGRSLEEACFIPGGGIPETMRACLPALWPLLALLVGQGAAMISTADHFGLLGQLPEGAARGIVLTGGHGHPRC